MTREELVEKMGAASHKAYYSSVGMDLTGKRLHEYLADAMLQVVIENKNEIFMADPHVGTVVLKPEFRRSQ